MDLCGQQVCAGMISRPGLTSEEPLSDSVEPLGRRLLIRKDESRQKTRGGIVLPDKAEIPTITGRIVAVSAQIERDQDFPVRKYDKVLFHPKDAIPVDFEADNLLFVVPIEDVVAVFRKVGKVKRPKVVAESEPDDVDDEPEFKADEGA